MALRGHASIQGSTDVPTLFHSLPGYLPMPSVDKQSWPEYVDGIRNESQKGFWQIGENYAVSLMKSYWGDAATKENGWGYDLMPRISGAHSTYETLMAMLDEQVEGYFVFGQNPAVAQSNGGMQRRGLAALKWLVVRDFQEIETASFWKDSPEIKKRRAQDRRYRYRGFLDAGGNPRGKGRYLHPNPAHVAMAFPGGTAAR